MLILEKEMNRVSESEVFRGKFFAAFARNPPATWYEIWSLCWEDRWFQGELDKQTHGVLSGTCGKTHWLYDTCHEAMLILASKLRNDPSLGLHSGLGDDFFVVMDTIVRNAARQAFRRLRRIYRTGTAITEEVSRDAAEERFNLCQQAVDISAAIDDLPEPLCTVLRLFQLGYSIKEISKSLKFSARRTYRAFHKGLRKIRRDFRLPDFTKDDHLPEPGTSRRSR